MVSQAYRLLLKERQTDAWALTALCKQLQFFSSFTLSYWKMLFFLQMMVSKDKGKVRDFGKHAYSLSAR